MASYPIFRNQYCRILGDLREKRIVEVLKALLPSYEVFSHSHVSVNGADITIVNNCKPIAKFEVLNEDLSSYIDSKRALSIRKNLRGVLYKGLICSHANLTKEAKKILKNIPILRIDFQTLPKEFHSFYFKINKVFKRKIANEKSLKLLKNLILSFLIKLGFPLLMYVTTNNEMSTTYSSLLSTSRMYVTNNRSSKQSLSSILSRSGCLMCDGGSAIFPLRPMVVQKPKKARKKRVFPFVDREKPMVQVSFRYRFKEKRNQWMVYDCSDCLCYDFCYLRDELTKAYERFLEGKGLTLWEFEEIKGEEKITLVSLLNGSKEDREKFLKIRYWRGKMWKCLKGRNRVQIFGNQKGRKREFFKTFIHENSNFQHRGE